STAGPRPALPDLACRRAEAGVYRTRLDAAPNWEAVMLKEFKAFLMRGNVLELAVGIVIGAAFGTVVTSFVNDILMPPIGLALGRGIFADMFISLTGQSFPSVAAAKAAGAPTLNYGAFINNVINLDRKSA